MDRSRPSPSSPRLPVWGSVQSNLPVGPDRTEPYPRPGPSGLVESLSTSRRSYDWRLRMRPQSDHSNIDSIFDALFTSPQMHGFSKITSRGLNKFRTDAKYRNKWPLIEYTLHYITDHIGLCSPNQEVSELVTPLVRQLVNNQVSYFLGSFIDCSSPVTEDVPPRRDRSIHGVPPSVTGLVHSRSVPRHPTSVTGLVHSWSIHTKC